MNLNELEPLFNDLHQKIHEYVQNVEDVARRREDALRRQYQEKNLQWVYARKKNDELRLEIGSWKQEIINLAETVAELTAENDTLKQGLKEKSEKNRALNEKLEGHKK